VSSQDLKTYLEGSVYCSHDENRAIIQFPFLISSQESRWLVNKNVIAMINDDDDKTDVLGHGMS
jgi:hypothetical protein